LTADTLTLTNERFTNHFNAFILPNDKFYTASMGYPDEKKRGSQSSSKEGNGHPFHDYYDDSKQLPSPPSVGTSASAQPPPLPSRQPSTIHRTATSSTTRNSVRSSYSPARDDYREVYRDLTQIYKRKIRPLETTYNFEGFHSAPLTDSDILAKPMVLLLGQYSTVSQRVAR
jgi:hypothetical protein